ncbi:lipase 3-like [Schistocerca gregaria]|uniref:lipase 3-like n=1 Tax=Schistocerca gregaria TaxID=7010 RepID=UPI00211F3F54|nr:lipase 3-like [Schistocerca gregaria]
MEAVRSDPQRSVTLMVPGRGDAEEESQPVGSPDADAVAMDTNISLPAEMCWHEHGIYDMPAQIDHVLNTTGHQQIYYVGHSMGTTMFYVGMSMKPEYNEKIRAMFSLAPIAYMNHMISPLFQLLAPFTTSAQVLMDLIGASKFTPSQEMIRLIQPKICKEKAITEPMCTNVVFLICGFDKEQIVKIIFQASS